MAERATRNAAIVVGLGAVGWALCGASIGIGFAITTELGALIIHAVAAPLIFAALTWLAFTRFPYTTPLRTALMFIAVVIFLDVFVVALLINKSFAMFASVLGTWLPFALIVASTYLTGTAIERRRAAPG